VNDLTTGNGAEHTSAAMSAECKRLRDESADGPDCGCPGHTCVLDVPFTVETQQRPLLPPDDCNYESFKVTGYE
jgi:hypothetical protein